MNTTTKIVLAALIGIVVGAGGAMAFNKSEARMAANTSGGHMMPDGSTMGASMNGMRGEMDSMMQGLSGKTGDTFDQVFLSEMIVHHQGAVAMAQAALTSAKHQEIKDLAKNIISAQNTEIKEMQDWQKAWYGN